MANNLDGNPTSQALSRLQSRPFYHKLAAAEEVLIEDVSAKTERCPDNGEPCENLFDSSSPQPEKLKERRHRSFRKRWFERTRSCSSVNLRGWRSGLWVGLWTSFAVLIGNVIIVVLGASRHGGYVDGIGILDIGQTDKIASISTAYHIVINILSTALLTSSNFCMQILSSPTRQEVDTAHKRGIWLSIGVLSPGNLRHISSTRFILWWLLALSSLPLHLVYNTSIFAVTIGHDYDVTIANGSDFANVKGLLQGNLRNLTNDQWTKLYNTQYVPNAGDLILVAEYFWFDANLSTEHSNWQVTDISNGGSPQVLLRNSTMKAWLNTTQSELQLNEDGTFGTVPVQKQFRVLSDLTTRPQRLKPFAGNVSDGYDFRIPTTFHVSAATATSYLTTVAVVDDLSNARLWMQNPCVSIGYGLSQSISNGSQIQISRAFIVVVICCNIVKVVAIYATIRLTSSTSFRPLITGGDVIASYLEDPDPMTTGMCLFDRQSIVRSASKNTTPSPRMWESKVRVLGNAAAGDVGSLMAMYFPIALSIALSMMGLAFAFPSSGPDLSAQGAMMWGTSSQRQLGIAKSFFDTRGVLFNAWLANAPQVLLSISYVATNRICTALSFALEWDQYTSKRKKLRVSSPSGQQRGTYFLQLPLRRAIPLTTISCLLHWLLSQTIFLVRLDIRDHAGNIVVSESKSTCCYSLLSFAVFVAVFVLLQLVVLVFMLQRIRPRIPAAECCSLLISAACHPPSGEVDPHLRPVQWGVVPADFGTIGHCTFSSEPVMAVRSGCEYA